MTKPGVWRSDRDGHLLILKLNPTAVTCVICMKTCDRSACKDWDAFKKAAEGFTSEHGYLDEHIANDLAEIIPPRQAK